MNHYVLSHKTEEDIEDIYNYGIYRFGKDQALGYLIALQSYLQILVKNPEVGKQRDEIKKGLYSFPYESHIIFYRIFKNHIRTVRILHGSRDLKKYLS